MASTYKILALTFNVNEEDDLLRSRTAQFSLDALANIAAALGRKVAVSLDDAA